MILYSKKVGKLQSVQRFEGTGYRLNSFSLVLVTSSSINEDECMV